MEKIRNKVIDGIEWVAALGLTTVILFALMLIPGLIEIII